jgi:hypothetical protein
MDAFQRTSEDRYEIFRKVKQIALYRFQFRRDESSRRSRKVVPLYYGLPLIYDICDGNPRILIGMVDEFLSLSSKNGTLRELTINEQSRILYDLSSKYLSVISCHPEANVNIKDKNFNLKELLVQIGEFFHVRMVDEPFNMDPKSSFIIDEEINAKLLQLLELALYLGAIVYLDSSEPLSHKGLIGKKFRLSYTLSPAFSLLCREFNSINLSTILKRDFLRENQQTLFNNDAID